MTTTPTNNIMTQSECETKCKPIKLASNQLIIAGQWYNMTADDATTLKKKISVITMTNIIAQKTRRTVTANISVRSLYDSSFTGYKNLPPLTTEKFALITKANQYENIAFIELDNEQGSYMSMWPGTFERQNVPFVTDANLSHPCSWISFNTQAAVAAVTGPGLASFIAYTTPAPGKQQDQLYTIDNAKFIEGLSESPHKVNYKLLNGHIHLLQLVPGDPNTWNAFVYNLKPSNINRWLGYYTVIPATSAITTSSTKYSCTGGKCSPDPKGTMTQSECETKCTKEPITQKYSCAGGKCSPDPKGTMTQSECITKCTKEPITQKYSCAGGKCSPDPKGTMTQSECETKCKSFACNAGECLPVTGGKFTTMADCKAGCTPAPTNYNIIIVIIVMIIVIGLGIMYYKRTK